MSYFIVEIFDAEIKATVQTNNTKYSCLCCGQPLSYGFTKSGYTFQFDPITKQIHKAHPHNEVESKQKELADIRKNEKRKEPKRVSPDLD